MVQTFKNAELENVIFNIGDQDEWKSIANELGLDNQLNFVTSAKSPVPYPFINTSMNNIFESLCPSKTDVKEYRKTPIPLEVLKEIQFCVHENYFSTIKIWYDDKSPDPIAVGVRRLYKTYYKVDGETKCTNYEFHSEEEAKSYVQLIGAKQDSIHSEDTSYLIARWADELRPMQELRKLAIERLSEKYSNEWQLKLESLQRKLENVSGNIKRFVDGDISRWELERDL